jgi:pSer/pThr/pTyr-binding forkhead associated (FHA) protein
MEGMRGDDVPSGSEREGYRVCTQDRNVLLGEGEVVIGRSPYCSLVLDHETLSRVHASLRVVEDGVELSDLGSSNGTFVNGEPVKGPMRVRIGDEIHLGKVTVWLEVASARISAATGRFTAAAVPRVRERESDHDDTTIAPRGLNEEK